MSQIITITIHGPASAEAKPRIATSAGRALRLVAWGIWTFYKFAFWTMFCLIAGILWGVLGRK